MGIWTVQQSTLVFPSSVVIHLSLDKPVGRRNAWHNLSVVLASSGTTCRSAMKMVGLRPQEAQRNTWDYDGLKRRWIS